MITKALPLQGQLATPEACKGRKQTFYITYLDAERFYYR